MALINTLILQVPHYCNLPSLLPFAQSNDCYAECYPGMGFEDHVDSDDEADYTKMDQGNFPIHVYLKLT